MINFNQNIHSDSLPQKNPKNNDQNEKYIVEGKIEISAENIFFAIDNFKTSLMPGTTFYITNVFVIKNDDFIIDVTHCFKNDDEQTIKQ